MRVFELAHPPLSPYKNEILATPLIGGYTSILNSNNNRVYIRSITNKMRVCLTKKYFYEEIIFPLIIFYSHL